MSFLSNKYIVLVLRIIIGGILIYYSCDNFFNQKLWLLAILGFLLGIHFIFSKNFLLSLRLLVGGVFIYASFDKLMNQEEFSKAIYNYKFLPGIFINIFAIVIPYIELISGLFLIIGIYKRGSSFIISFLLIIFIIALGQAYARGLDIDCACFSLATSGQKSDILRRIIEDILLLIASIIIYIKSKITINKENQP